MAACLYGAFPAVAELAQRGDVLVSVDAGFSPRSLPRHKPAPIKVRVGGSIRSTKRGVSYPQMHGLTLAVNSAAGVLHSRGLDTCNPREIQPATEQEARRICGAAIVGRGEATAQVRLPNQRPFDVEAEILVYNGPLRHGQNLLIAQAYIKDPPASFILPFRVQQTKGPFGLVLSAELPPEVRSVVYIRKFKAEFGRIYSYRGQRISWLEAACAAPAGFPGATFPVAQVMYDFGNGRTLGSTIVQSCSVRG